MLAHRGQVLLVLVALLVGVTLCCVVLDLLGVPLFEPLELDGRFVSHQPELPSRIVIDGDRGHEPTLVPAPSGPKPTPTATVRMPGVRSSDPPAGGHDG